MQMNRAAFFTSLRRRDSGVFGTSLSEKQVKGVEALLDACEGYPLSEAAHVLAEVYRETGGGMWPVKETVYPHSKDKNPPDSVVIARLERAWQRGQLPWVRVPYWRDGWFGRGQIQLTHEDNYRKASALVDVDLVSNPSAALNLEVSAKIAAEGCRAGMFRGHRLADFDRPDGYDHYNARDIVNGDKKAVGDEIARYGAAFERALESAGWRSPPIMPPDVLIPDEPPAAPWWVHFLQAIKRAFK